MARKGKKLRQTRGHNRRHGGGKRCRGAGNRGGRGRAGLGKRAAQNKLKYLKHPELGRPGKHGFRSLPQRAGIRQSIINVEHLDKLATKLGKTELDLAEMGYDKLVGSGKVTQKIIVHVASFSESAKQKIESAGGRIVSK